MKVEFQSPPIGAKWIDFQPINNIHILIQACIYINYNN